MSSKPFIPWFFSDLVGDTLHLTNAQFGSYSLLLGAMWNAGGFLSDDQGELRRIARCDAGKWAKCWKAIERYFIIEDGTVTQANLLRKIAKHADVSASRQKAANARWHGELGSLSKVVQDRLPSFDTKPLKYKKVMHANAYAKRMQPEPEKIDDPKGSNLSSPTLMHHAGPSGRPDGPSGPASEGGATMNRIQARAELRDALGEDFAASYFDKSDYVDGLGKAPDTLVAWSGHAHLQLRTRAHGVLKAHNIQLEPPSHQIAAAPIPPGGARAKKSPAG